MENTIEKKLEKAAISFTKFKEQYAACKYLYLPKTDEGKKYLQNNRYFKMVKIALFRNCIIELCKITKGSKNNYFNLSAIINTAKKHRISESGSNAEINKIEIIYNEIEPLTNRIITLRNDFIAHTKLNQVDPNITFEELDKYIKVIEEIIKHLYRLVKDSQMEFKPILFESERFDIISILAKNNVERRNTMMESFRNPKAK